MEAPRRKNDKKARKRGVAQAPALRLTKGNLLEEGAYGKVYDIGKLEGLQCVLKLSNIWEADEYDDSESDSDSDAEDMGPSSAFLEESTLHHSCVREILVPQLYVASRKTGDCFRLCPTLNVKLQKDKVASIMPNCGVSLEDCLDECKTPLSLGTVRVVLRQVLSAVNEVQNLMPRCFHGDIKPQNLMLARDAGGRVHCTLIDWSFTRSEVGCRAESFSTDWFYSPEMMISHEEDCQEPPRSSDVWGCGMVAAWMLMGKDAMESMYRESRKKNGGIESSRSWMNVAADLIGLPEPWTCVKQIRREDDLEEVANDQRFECGLMNSMLEGRQKCDDLKTCLSAIMTVDWSRRPSATQALALLDEPTAREHEVAAQELLDALEEKPVLDQAETERHVQELFGRDVKEDCDAEQVDGSAVSECEVIEALVDLAQHSDMQPMAFCMALTLCRVLKSHKLFGGDPNRCARVSVLIAIAMSHAPMERQEIDQLGIKDKDLAVACRLCMSPSAVERIRWGISQAYLVRNQTLLAFANEQRPTRRSFCSFLESLPEAILSSAGRDALTQSVQSLVASSIEYGNGTVREGSRFLGRWKSRAW